jgi:hypothetical protein
LRKPTKDDALAQEFEVLFWPSVPVKIGKGAARKAYVAARKAGTSAEDISAGIATWHGREEARKRASRNGDYRPLHPSTWLHQERWTDASVETVEARAPTLSNEMNDLPF